MVYYLSSVAKTLYIIPRHTRPSGTTEILPYFRFSHFGILYRLTNPWGSAPSLTAEYIKVNWIKSEKRMTDDWKVRGWVSARAGSSTEMLVFTLENIELEEKIPLTDRLLPSQTTSTVTGSLMEHLNNVTETMSFCRFWAKRKIRNFEKCTELSLECLQKYS